MDYKVGDWIPLLDWAKLPELSGLYIIKNMVDGKEYVGQSKNIRTRLGTHVSNNKKSQYLHRAFKHHGLTAFQVCIYLLDNLENLGGLETLLIEERKSMSPNGYNLTSGGEGRWNVVVSQETRQKLREANLGKRYSSETKLKKSLAMSGRKCSTEHTAKTTLAKIGRKRSLETVAKMRTAATGRSISEDTRKKIGLKSLGHALSPEARKKISIANTGKVRSLETRLKIGQVQLGRKASEETKERMRESALRIKALKEKPVFLWELESMCPKLFNSASELAVYLNTSLGNVSSWGIGKSFPRNLNIAVAYTEQPQLPRLGQSLLLKDLRYA